MILAAIVPSCSYSPGGLTALSLCVAWPMDSTAGFHAVMNLFLMPMWFLSGAVFPVSGAPWPMQILMYLNPLTYGHATFSGLLTGQHHTTAAPLVVSLTIMLMFTAAAIVIAGRVVAKPRKDGLA